jgi:hypothetical protein
VNRFAILSITSALLLLLLSSNVVALDSIEATLLRARCVRDNLRATVVKDAVKVARSTWSPDKFTDPRHHNPQNFRYIIRNNSRLNLKEARSLSNFQKMSVSVISESYQGVFMSAHYAYILKVPSRNVIASSVFDMHDREMTPEQLQIKFGLDTPGVLIEKSVQNRNTPQFGLTGWNEVVISGNNVVVSGIVVFKKRATETSTLIATEFARKLKGPVVYVDGE